MLETIRKHLKTYENARKRSKPQKIFSSSWGTRDVNLLGECAVTRSDVVAAAAAVTATAAIAEGTAAAAAVAVAAARAAPRQWRWCSGGAHPPSKLAPRVPHLIFFEFSRFVRRFLNAFAHLIR